MTVVPCALLGREHVYTVAAVRLPDGLTDETDDCPLGVGYELFSTNARIEGAVMPGPLRRFCLFE